MGCEVRTISGKLFIRPEFFIIPIDYRYSGIPEFSKTDGRIVSLKYVNHAKVNEDSGVFLTADRMTDRIY